MAEKIKVAVAGNPNVGKTTIFNALTGARQKVGNWPGVTVEKKEGTKKHKDHILEIVDLPGTYSLTAYSADEVVARDYILEEKPDVVVQVLDSTNLERNLYLTSQLLEMGTNLVLALNMSDRAETRGDDIDIRRLESLLGVSAIKTAANEGRGINALLDSIVNKTESNPPLPHEIGYGGRVEENICALEEILGSDRELSKNYPSRWMAVKLLEARL